MEIYKERTRDSIKKYRIVPRASDKMRESRRRTIRNCPDSGPAERTAGPSVFVRRLSTLPPSPSPPCLSVAKHNRRGGPASRVTRLLKLVGRKRVYRCSQMRAPSEAWTHSVLFHKLASMPLPDSSKMRSVVASRNAPAAVSSANRSEPSAPNLSVTCSAVTPETLTLFSPSV